MRLKFKNWLVITALVCGVTVPTNGQAHAAGLFSGLCGESACCDDGCCDTGMCCEEIDCEGDCCDSGCDSLAGCNASDMAAQCLPQLDSFARKLDCVGCIRKSDHCFDDFISPMIDFVHFEDPRNLTELRPIFVSQNIPEALGGGNFQVYAMQFRIALSERLSLIAVKDGYVVDNTDGLIGGALNSGWADVTAGLKYNFLRNVQTGTLASAGFTYEIPMGSEGALQAQGDGEFHFFASAAQRLLDGNAHFMTSFGWQVPVDQDAQATTIHWNNHFDVRLSDSLYLFTENSWWHWVKEGNGPALGVAGSDLLNLGFSGVEGNHLVTHNVGAKYKPNGGMELGIAYEFPLTDFQDIMDDRLQIEAILRY